MMKINRRALKKLLELGSAMNFYYSERDMECKYSYRLERPVEREYWLWLVNDETEATLCVGYFNTLKSLIACCDYIIDSHDWFNDEHKFQSCPCYKD